MATGKVSCTVSLVGIHAYTGTGRVSTAKDGHSIQPKGQGHTFLVVFADVSGQNGQRIQSKQTVLQMDVASP